MTSWSLQQLLASLHEDIERRLGAARQTFGHAPTKGDASQHVWLELLNNYLPRRYSASTAHVVDSKGAFSQQIDVLIYDRQYSPFIFHFEGQAIIPAESVYAVFEAKQTVNADLIAYAQEKAASVRVLHRTSIPIPHAGGVYPPKEPNYIIGGILAFDSDWTPPLGEPLANALKRGTVREHLDIGCIATHGIFVSDEAGSYSIRPQGKPATAFLMELISRLQSSATVPMIDVQAYAKWLKD